MVEFSSDQKKLIDIEIVNRKEFESTLNNAKDNARDFRVPFALIARAQFKFQRQIFLLKGRGKYEPLKRPQEKFKKVGFIFPILLRTGRLAASLLQPGGENVLLLGQQSMFYGSAVPYAIYHQFGTQNMARRPFLFIDEQRLMTFRNIIKDHMKKAFVKPILGSIGSQGVE